MHVCAQACELQRSTLGILLYLIHTGSLAELGAHRIGQSGWPANSREPPVSTFPAMVKTWVLGIKLRFTGLHGKHFINSVISPAPKLNLYKAEKKIVQTEVPGK